MDGTILALLILLLIIIEIKNKPSRSWPLGRFT